MVAVMAPQDTIEELSHGDLADLSTGGRHVGLDFYDLLIEALKTPHDLRVFLAEVSDELAFIVVLEQRR
jgi:hypothetical protein